MNNHKLSIFSLDRKTVFMFLFMIFEIIVMLILFSLLIKLDVNIEGFKSKLSISIVFVALFFTLGLMYDKLDRRFFGYAYPRR